VSTLLTDILRAPSDSLKLDRRNWETLIWQGRAAELLGQLRSVLHEADLLECAPWEARRHLEGAWKISQLHNAAVRYELGHIRDALSELDIPVVLLKGAAYCAQNNSAATGRVFNDIDILIPKASLEIAEERMLGAGWIPTHLNTYDQRYYREWMHELPPMEHKNRATVLDVHHTIIPPTAGIKLSPEKLFASALAIQDPKLAFFKALGPEDIVIHSSCHLFFGEFHKGLRDLYDLHKLFTEHAAEKAFWEKLVIRAEDLGLAQPVLDALNESKRLFGTAVPKLTVDQLSNKRGNTVSKFARSWLFEIALRPNHHSAKTTWSHFAQWIIFARSHWLRMPLPLLVFHLTHKALFPEKKNH
jgi:hypothetical protein